MLRSAHARACLLGEHCDWAGQGASLVLPLANRLEVQVRAADWGLVIHSELGVTRVDATGRCLDSDPNRYVVAAARTLARHGVKLPPSRVVVRSEIPMGRGLGSSAALLVASLRALGAHAGVMLDRDQAAAWALEAESQDLGVPCGPLDPLACAFDQPQRIRWPDQQRKALGKAPPTLVVLLPDPVPAAPILEALNAARDQPAVQAALRTWGEAAEQGAQDLDRQDWAALGQKLDRAQAAYDSLDLPALQAPRLGALIAELRGLGALGAKFMGAGGERSAVAVFSTPSHLADAQRVLESRGLQCLSGGV